MERLNSKQLIEGIEPFTGTFDAKQPYLWIWNPLEIPPHMGISIENAYFSLKWNGKDEALNCNEMIQRIQRKGLPVLALQLDANFSVEACRNVFSLYERTVPNSITCLEPIKDLLHHKQPTKLSELLATLATKKQVRAAFGFNLAVTSIELPEYTVEDIHYYLQNRIN